MTWLSVNSSLSKSLCKRPNIRRGLTLELNSTKELPCFVFGFCCWQLFVWQLPWFEFPGLVRIGRCCGWLLSHRIGASCLLNRLCANESPDCFIGFPSLSTWIFEFQKTLLRFPQISLILNSKLADAFLSFHWRFSSETASSSGIPQWLSRSQASVIQWAGVYRQRKQDTIDILKFSSRQLVHPYGVGRAAFPNATSLNAGIRDAASVSRLWILTAIFRLWISTVNCSNIRRAFVLTQKTLSCRY